MSEEIFFNIKAGLQAEQVDQLNDRFYSRFNYPWVPMMLPKPHDPQFWVRALNMDLGNYRSPQFQQNMKIWVAGCGTNQAVLTALKFPHAQVTGSDVSTESLKVCGRVAQQLGLQNLTLRQESLNHTAYENEFDYVICTGVIHHNADPAVPLASLARGLKPSGVMELMVYNYYHRIQTTAFQKAIRLLGGGTGLPDVERELPLTQRLIASFPESMPGGSHMAEFLALQRSLPEAAVADSLLQPVEYSYTVASLAELAQRNNLKLATYCVNQFDKVTGHLHWESEFADPQVAASYALLSDQERWQVSNLLRGEKSPMLWFYLQREDHPQAMPSAQQLTESFLDTVFVAAQASMQNYVLSGPEEYRLSPATIPLPAPAKPIDPASATVLAALDGVCTMRQILSRLGLSAQAERLRLRLATSGFPYLRVVE